MRTLWDQQVERSRAIVMNDGVEVNEVEPAPFAKAMMGMWERSLDNTQQRNLLERVLALRTGAL